MIKKIILILFILVASFVFAQEERLTITTYYPSPYGSYRRLRVGSSFPPQFTGQSPTIDGAIVASMLDDPADSNQAFKAAVWGLSSQTGVWGTLGYDAYNA
ncbi:MAG: hypothetical protein N2Z79_02475, partial [Candidatus Omnitrophica bacterium]|nr:hypothetical protein [Candidatus Omnitrophota bacterium]